MTAGGVVVCGARIGFAMPEHFWRELCDAFRHATIARTSGEPTMWYRFLDEGANGRFVREDPVRSGDRVHIGRSLSDLIDDLHLSVALHAQEHVFVHSGVVEWHGKAILIPGRSHSGKSTLVHALVEHGATYLSDEYALITANGSVAPYARPIQLRSGSERKMVDPHMIGSVGVATIEPSLILFTRFEEDSEFDPTPVLPASAALALFDNTVVAEVQPSAATAAAAQVARRALALRTARPDAGVVAAAILRLAEGCG